MLYVWQLGWTWRALSQVKKVSHRTNNTRFHFFEAFKSIILIKAERMVVARGQWEGKMRNCLSKGIMFQFCKMSKFSLNSPIMYLLTLYFLDCWLLIRMINLVSVHSDYYFMSMKMRIPFFSSIVWFFNCFLKCIQETDI